VKSNIEISKVPENSKLFYENPRLGGCGTEQPSILIPDMEVDFFLHLPESSGNPNTELKTLVDIKSNSESKLEDEKIPSTCVRELTSIPVKKFGKLIWGEEKSVYELETFYEGYSDIYMSKYVDLVDSDGTMNECYYKWSKKTQTTT